MSVSGRQNKENNYEKIMEIVGSTGLKVISVHEIIDYLKNDLLLSLYRTGEDLRDDFDKEINSRIEKAWEVLNPKSKFDEGALLKKKPIPYFLYGLPGHGKTAAYNVAGKEVAAMLGLNFKNRITENYKPSREDMIMVVHESAGENSSVSYGGAPKAETITFGEEERTVLKRAINYRFAMFEQTAGGILLLDDAANASEVIQNIFLPIAQEQSFQGMRLPNCMVGFTGNLGALDGTFVQDQSQALKTRVTSVMVLNNPEDFLDNAYKVFNDSLGDVGMFGFIKRNADLFYSLPDTTKKTGYINPRTLEDFIHRVRVKAHQAGGRANLDTVLDAIELYANNMFGYDSGLLVGAYYKSYVSGADPMANDFINTGKVDIERFRAAYGNGASSDAVTFGYQYAMSCGDYAVALLSDIAKKGKVAKKDIQLVSERFGNAVLLLNDSEFNLAVDHFQNRLAASFPALAVPNTKRFNLKLETKEIISETISGLENCDAVKSHSLTVVLSGIDKIDNDVNQVVRVNVGRKPKFS